MIMAQSCSRVPKFTVMCNGSFWRGANYGMCGRAFDARFLFTWPNHQIGVMGGDQAANTLAEVKANQMRRNGETVDDAVIKALWDDTRKAYEDQLSAYYSTSQLWDDGIIDPVDTRKRPCRRHVRRNERTPWGTKVMASSASDTDRAGRADVLYRFRVALCLCRLRPDHRTGRRTPRGSVAAPGAGLGDPEGTEHSAPARQPRPRGVFCSGHAPVGGFSRPALRAAGRNADLRPPGRAPLARPWVGGSTGPCTGDIPGALCPAT